MIERLGVRNILVRDLDMRDEDLREVRETSPGVSPRDAIASGIALLTEQMAVLTAEAEQRRRQREAFTDLTEDLSRVSGEAILKFPTSPAPASLPIA